MENLFNELKNLMELGYTKSEACAKLKIDRSNIYRKLTPQQMRILDEIYYSFSNGSTRTKWEVEKNF